MTKCWIFASNELLCGQQLHGTWRMVLRTHSLIPEAVWCNYMPGTVPGTEQTPGASPALWPWTNDTIPSRPFSSCKMWGGGPHDLVGRPGFWFQLCYRILGKSLHPSGPQFSTAINRELISNPLRCLLTQKFWVRWPRCPRIPFRLSQSLILLVLELICFRDWFF